MPLMSVVDARGCAVHTLRTFIWTHDCENGCTFVRLLLLLYAPTAGERVQCRQICTCKDSRCARPAEIALGRTTDGQCSAVCWH